MKTVLNLIVEKGNGALWGRVNVNDNLITAEAKTVEELESAIHDLVLDFEDIDAEFEKQYDVFALFQQFDFLNITKVAKYAEINPGLLRQYSSGVKHPSQSQAKKIEETLHRLADELKNAAVFA